MNKTFFESRFRFIDQFVWRTYFGQRCQPNWDISQYYSYKTRYYWPAPPDDPQGIRVASVIEFSVCVSVCLFVLSKFSNFFLQYKATAVRAVISIMYGSEEGV